MKTLQEVRIECLRLVAPWVTAKVIPPKDMLVFAAILHQWVLNDQGEKAKDL